MVATTSTSRYHWNDRQLNSRKKHTSSRRQEGRVYKKQNSRTPAELQALKVRRQVEKTYAQKVHELSAKVYDLAEELYGEFPQYATSKIYRSVLQFPRKAATTRRVNAWNTFQSMKAKELNAGKFIRNINGLKIRD